VRSRYSSVEFLLVVGIAFGWAISGSIAAFVYGYTAGEASASGSTFGKSHLYGVVIKELVAFPVLALVLYAGGWRAKDFPLGIGTATTAIGVGIFLAVWCVDGLIYAALEQIFPTMRAAMEGVEAYRPSNPPDLTSVIVASLVNPVFEEVFVCGYVISALSGRFGVTAAVNTSVVIRALYHLYQGIEALPFHLAYGLIQAYSFVRLGKLWPLILSHALLDFFALLYYV
jgi:membrane protease YdiL (CAAX protease family)